MMLGTHDTDKVVLWARVWLLNAFNVKEERWKLKKVNLLPILKDKKKSEGKGNKGKNESMGENRNTGKGKEISLLIFEATN